MPPGSSKSALTPWTPAKACRTRGWIPWKLLFLIDALESRFDVRLVGENLGPNDFRSVDSICRLLGGDHADHA